MVCLYGNRRGALLSDYESCIPVVEVRPHGRLHTPMVPELAGLDPKAIHDPYGQKQAPIGLDYPKPMVDLKASRQAAIDAFKQLSKETS